MCKKKEETNQVEYRDREMSEAVMCKKKEEKNRVRTCKYKLEERGLPDRNRLKPFCAENENTKTTMHNTENAIHCVNPY